MDANSNNVDTIRQSYIKENNYVSIPKNFCTLMLVINFIALLMEVTKGFSFKFKKKKNEEKKLFFSICSRLQKTMTIVKKMRRRKSGREKC